MFLSCGLSVVLCTALECYKNILNKPSLLLRIQTGLIIRSCEQQMHPFGSDCGLTSGSALWVPTGSGSSGLCSGGFCPDRPSTDNALGG